jgi:DnaJ-class molecular chaperone
MSRCRRLRAQEMRDVIGMAKKDYYAVLMVHQSAEQFLIEAAYRRLAREYHPDVSNAPNAHQRMVDVNEAYEVLSDPIRRKVYDAECSERSISRQENARTASGSTSATSAASRPQPSRTERATAVVFTSQ